MTVVKFESKVIGPGRRCTNNCTVPFIIKIKFYRIGTKNQEREKEKSLKVSDEC